MLARFRRVRPVLVAWALSALLAAASALVVLADGGGTPYPH
jgi:hypothetical protein